MGGREAAIKPSSYYLVGQICAKKVMNIYALMEVMTKSFKAKGKLTARECRKGMIIFSFERKDDQEWVLKNQP